MKYPKPYSIYLRGGSKLWKLYYDSFRRGFGSRVWDAGSRVFRVKFEVWDIRC